MHFNNIYHSIIVDTLGIQAIFLLNYIFALHRHISVLSILGQALRAVGGNGRSPQDHGLCPLREEGDLQQAQVKIASFKKNPTS